MSTILLVEQSPPLQELLITMLNFADYEVKVARNVVEALHILTHTAIDLLIVEPFHEGIEWLASFVGRVPILILSSAPIKVARSMAEKVGAAYLSKPFKMHALFVIIRRLLAERMPEVA